MTVIGYEFVGKILGGIYGYRRECFRDPNEVHLHPDTFDALRRFGLSLTNATKEQIEAIPDDDPFCIYGVLAVKDASVKPGEFTLRSKRRVRYGDIERFYDTDKMATHLAKRRYVTWHEGREVKGMWDWVPADHPEDDAT
jgi:hypothetical protein